MTIIAVLQSFMETLFAFIKEALCFYWRLLTNKAGLPRWLWIAMLVSWTLIIASIFANDVFAR